MARYKHEGHYGQKPGALSEGAGRMLEGDEDDNRALRDLRHIRNDIAALSRWMRAGIVMAVAVYLGHLIYWYYS